MTSETVNVVLNPATGKWQAEYKGVKVSSKYKEYVKTQLKELTGKTFNVTYDTTDDSPKEVAERYDINQRFTFVEQLVRMIAKKQQASVVITGQGGLGKSYTVLNTLMAEGLEDYSILSEDLEDGATLPKKRFVVIKGYSTAKGLYRFLHANNGAVIVFDDCDSILKDRDALMILKGALDSNDRRIIAWNAEMPMGSDLPKAFEFTGHVVFISNMQLKDIDQAIQTRSMCVDVTMTTDQKIERMEFILASGKFMPQFSVHHKREALNLIKELKAEVKEISLRTLISVSKIHAANEGNWKDLATYMLTN